ncbi:MAG: hypothetical protein ABSC05_07825 [Candidatus Solibacter sp.]|jgi:hypothetical protein
MQRDEMREIQVSDARIVPEVNRRQEEIDSAIEGIVALRKRNGKITSEELRAAREEGLKY